MKNAGISADEQRRQAFLGALMAGNDAEWSLCDGIMFCRLRAGTKVGLALRIPLHAIKAGQLQRVLERRFEQALAFDGLFAYLDDERALVIWQAMPERHERALLDGMLSRSLSLAELERLDAYCTCY